MLGHEIKDLGDGGRSSEGDLGGGDRKKESSQVMAIAYWHIHGLC